MHPSFWIEVIIGGYCLHLKIIQKRQNLLGVLSSILHTPYPNA